MTLHRVALRHELRAAVGSLPDGGVSRAQGLRGACTRTLGRGHAWPATANRRRSSS